MGLQVRGTHIVSSPVPVGHVASMIVLVAADFLEKVSEKLVSKFGKARVARETELSGASNRVYRFDFLVHAGSSILVVDHVSPHANSINAKAAAHIDLGRRDTLPINGHVLSEKQQAIVYDSSLGWQAADLTFLQTAAQLVPYAKMGEALAQIQTGKLV
jgi:hypothetical protein